MINTKIIPEISGIYKFTNKIDNKVYIGQTKNLRRRIKDHLEDYKKDKSNSYFYKAIRNHKIENFEVELILEGNFTKIELNEMEIRLIELFKSNNHLFGYNLTKGGCAFNTIVSEETKKKMSKSQTGRKHTEETKKKIGSNTKGKIVSEESKEKMSKSQTGKKLKEETKQKISESNKGKKMKPESIEKTRQANLGRKFTQEHIEKLKVSHLGYVHTEQTKQKMSESKKGKKQSLEHVEKNRQAHLGKKLKPESIEKRTRTRKFNNIIKYFAKNNWIYDWVI